MPIDPKTGKEYPYTEEGIKQHKEDTSFKMKNSALHMGAKHRSPIQGNYGSPKKEVKRK